LAHQSSLQASLDFSVDEKGLNAVLSDAAGTFHFESDASGHVHFSGMMALEGGVIPPFGDQILFCGLMRWATKHAVCASHGEHHARDVGKFHGASVDHVIAG
tara:strand:+ start:255 stop:560 length:306 start_codon:yes stop_codon:yes gene_type:complete